MWISIGIAAFLIFIAAVIILAVRSMREAPEVLSESEDSYVIPDLSKFHNLQPIYKPVSLVAPAK